MEEKTAEYNDDLLLNHKINILNNANKGNILDLCVVSTFLKINFIKIDNKLNPTESVIRYFNSSFESMNKLILISSFSGIVKFKSFFYH